MRSTWLPDAAIDDAQLLARRMVRTFTSSYPDASSNELYEVLAGAVEVEVNRIRRARGEEILSIAERARRAARAKRDAEIMEEAERTRRR